MNKTRQVDQKYANSNWNLLRSTLNWAYDASVPTQYLKQSHYVSGQSAFLIRAGGVRVTTDRGTMSAGVGQWVFPREGLRTLEFEPDTWVLSMNFNLSWSGEYRMFDWDVAETCEAADIPLMEESAVELIHLLEDRYGITRTGLLSEKIGLRDHFIIRQRFYDWLLVYLEWLENRGHFLEQLRKVDVRLLRAVRYLDNLDWNKSFKESDIAEETGLSVSQAHRIFRSYFGCTPREYREGRRLEQALSRLRNTEESLKKLAYDLGFSSQSHFASWLRKKTRCSPSELRGGNSV